MNSKPILTFANGERKVLNSALHAFIANHPLTALLITLIIGVAIGALI